jgi:hypothetical protein
MWPHTAERDQDVGHRQIDLGGKIRLTTYANIRQYRLSSMRRMSSRLTTQLKLYPTFGYDKFEASKVQNNPVSAFHLKHNNFSSNCLK